MALAAAIYLGALNAAESLHNYLLHTTLRVPTSFFDVTPLGRIMNRFSKDVDTLDNILPHTLRAAINCLFSVRLILLSFICMEYIYFELLY